MHCSIEKVESIENIIQHCMHCSIENIESIENAIHRIPCSIESIDSIQDDRSSDYRQSVSSCEVSFMPVLGKSTLLMMKMMLLLMMLDMWYS